MGGLGSGSLPDHNGSRAGRKPKIAISVCGIGVPRIPDGLPEGCRPVWEWIVDLTAGVTFEQDSMAIEELARLWVRQQAVHRALMDQPADIDFGKLALANGRQLQLLWSKLGLTPRDRQVLLRPSMVDTDEPDELDMLRQDH